MKSIADIDADLAPVQSHLLKLIKTQDELIEEVDKNFKQSQKKMKSRWDKGKKLHDFECGQLVYVKNKFRQVQGTSEKLQPLYAGPYMIVELPSPFTVLIRRLSDGVTIKQTVHVERLKRVNFKKVGTEIRI